MLNFLLAFLIWGPPEHSRVNKTHLSCTGFMLVPKRKATLFYKDLQFMLNCKQQGLPNMFLISKFHIPTVVISSVTHLSHLLSLHYLLSQHLHIGCHGETRPLENLFGKMPATSIRHKSLGFFLLLKKALLWLFENLQFCLIYLANKRRCHWCVCVHTYIHTHIYIYGTCILEPCCSNCWGTVILLLY